MTKIEWSKQTWNPVTGCSKISTGCKNCYAELFAQRRKGMGQLKYAEGFNLALHENLLTKPFEWKKPKQIFVNSMSDLFHEDVPFEFIQKVFNTMNETPRHTYQILTKRSRNLLDLSKELNWTDNIWMGVTVENDDYADRIDHLYQTNAKIKFVSFEPLLNQIHNLDLDGIDWVIVGGESGTNARPMEKEWAIDILNQCVHYDIPFFFKQWGGRNKKKAGRLLKGRIWDQYPVN